MRGFQEVRDAGTDEVQFGNINCRADWRFYGLQRLIDVGPGEPPVPGLFHQADYELTFDVDELPQNISVPEAGTQTTLSLKGKTLDQLWVHGFQVIGDRIRVKLSNQLPDGMTILQARMNAGQNS